MRIMATRPTKKITIMNELKMENQWIYRDHVCVCVCVCVCVEEMIERDIGRGDSRERER